VTKIRSRDDSRIRDLRGRGGGGFGFPGMGRGGGMPFPTKAGGGLIGILVVLAALFLPKLLGGSGNPALSPGADEAPASEEVESCETEIEQIVCGAEGDAQGYWGRTFPRAFNREYEETFVTFFSGVVDTGCGQASSQTGPFYCPLDNYVYFDLDFLQQLQSEFGATGDLAAQYIVAHEFGHHVQNVLGINADVRQAQQQNPDQANQYSIALELQADCFAGAWAYDAARRGELDNQQEINEALNAAAAVGDDRIQERTQGRVDPESWTHGSSEQRVQWFRRGYSTGDPNQCDTFAELL
jgi:predicted metalloprotease